MDENEMIPEVENGGAEVAEGAAAEPVSENLPAGENHTETNAESGAKSADKGGKGSKKGGKKGKRRKLKMAIGICAAAALCGTGLGIGLLFIPQGGFVVNEDYASVSYEVAEGELFDPDTQYDDKGLDIFGRLNWTFQQKDEWYSSYQGYVYTTVDQDVKTVKQFKDGRLISTDISTSSMVNVAREFCYIPSADRVIWREASGGPASYNGFDTPWKTGDPVGNMTISGPEGFKAKNGLPATELSVYIFREDTVLSAEPVVDNGNGTYTITYHMSPEVWKAEDGSTEGAAAYYANQMKFTGGLTKVPSFDAIDISFTFNEKWENLKTEAHEKYTATMGFTVGCKADGVTEYSYDTPYLPLCNDYETYFKQYADMEATGAPDPTVDSMSALTEAFAPVINGPKTLQLDLTVNGKPVKGYLYADLGMNGNIPEFKEDGAVEAFINKLDVRAQIGNVGLYVNGGAAYLHAGDLKLKLTVSELMDLLTGLIGGSGEEAAEGEAQQETEEAGGILAELITDLLHEEGSGKANMHSELNFGEASAVLDFNYFIDEETLAVSLDCVKAAVGYKDLSVGAELRFTEDANAPLALTEEEKGTYAELADHVKKIVALIEGGELHADITYNGYGLNVQGGVDISFPAKADGELTEEEKKEKIKAQAALTVAYGGQEKKLGILYEKGVAYLDLDGVKLSADVKEAAELIKKYLPKDETAGKAGKEEAFSLAELIDTLLFTDALTANLTVTKGESATQIAIKADALIAALGFDLGSFSLGDLSVELAEKAITLSAPALGAELTIGQGTGFEANTAGYAELTEYAKAVSELYDHGHLEATVTYDDGKLYVNGTLGFDIASLTADGTFTLKYGKLEKAVGVIYTDHGLYLTIDELKLKVDTKKAVEIVKSVLNAAEPASLDDGKLDKILGKLFSFRFGDVLTVGAANDTLTLTVQGTELLRILLGEENGFDLGQIELSVKTDGTVAASALGGKAHVTVKKGTQTQPDLTGYYDVTDVLEQLPAILNAKALSLKGGLALQAGGTQIGLSIENGAISWKDGLHVYLQAVLTAGGAQHEIFLNVTDGEVALAIGGVGARIYYADLSEIETALLKVYDRVRGIVQDTIGEGAENPLPELKSLGDLLDLIKGGAALAEATEETVKETKSFDWTELVQSLVIGGSELENGIAHLGYRGLTLDVLDELTADGLLGVSLGFNAKNITVSGDVHVAILSEDIPAMPEIDYLGTEDFADLIDYLGAAIALVSENDVGVTLSGSVLSTEEKYNAFDHVKSVITGKIEYHTGKFPLSLDVEGEHLVVDPDVYLHISFAMVSSLAEDTNLELDITVVDADKTGAQDDILDFYITASTVGNGKAGYNPLKLYAPADEVMTLLSGVCTMFGLDVDLLNHFMIDKWLSAESVGELKGLGASLKTMLAGITGVGPILEKLDGAIGALNGLKENGLAGLGALFGGSGAAVPAAAAETGAPATEKGEFITALELSRATAEAEGFFTFSLNSDTLFAGEGLDDLKVTVKKAAGEDGSTLLTSFSVENVYNKAKTEKTSVSVAIGTEEVTPSHPSFDDGYFNVEAVDTLILALAKSATHGVNEDGTVYTGEETPHHYVLNTNFYINGTATLNLALGNWDIKEITIKVIAISVNLDEEGNVGINLRLEYDGMHMALAGLLGDSDVIKGNTTLDVTIKESPRAGEGLMLYMKRTQTTNSEQEALPAPIVVYRTLPLSNFMKNYMDQLCFMFNLSETIMNKIMDMVGSGSGSGSGGGTAEDTPTDLGNYLDKFVKSCSYGKAGTGDKWTLEANAEGLTGSTSFKKMVVAVTTDAAGYLRTIGADLDIAGVVAIHADLRWCNPGGKMDAGVRDITTDVALTVESAMDAALRGIDWAQTVYLEGQLTTLHFYLEGDEIGSQDVIFNPTTKQSFAKINYPEFTQEQLTRRPGYTPVWERVTEISHELKVYAKYRPNNYHLVFESEERIDGATDLGYEEEYDEAEGTYLYKKDWTFGDSIVLPFGANNEKEITYFECAHGHHYTDNDLTLHVYTEETVKFTAHWDYIVYKVEFMADGRVYETKAGHYNDPVEAPETNPGKTGYTFQNWDNKPETFTDRNTVQVNAVFEANTYEVTILSDHDIAGFDGAFVQTESGDTFAWKLNFTYDVKYALPQNVESGQYILQGFTCADDDTLYYDFLPNVLDETTFTAVWDERGVNVYFAGVEQPLNRKIGSQIARSAMPAVPEKKGYTGEWNFDGDSYTVVGETTIEAKYTPITFIINGYSRFYVEGFTKVSKEYDSEGVQGTEYYVKRLEFVYDSEEYHLHEGVSENIDGFDFDGWYTGRFGAGGEKITAINNDVLERIFHMNVGGGEVENALYANWIDNSVEVFLYSDFRFAEMTGNDVNGYYKSLIMKETYNIEKTEITSDEAGVRRLGWWYNDPDTGWRMITDVKEFRNTDHTVQAVVRLYAMWIEDISVKITNIETPSYMGGKHYNIAGTVTGGLAIGQKSKEIYGAVGMSYSANGLFVLYNADGSTSDAPGGTETIAIQYGEGNVGTFQKNDMNSLTFAGTVGKPIAEYGGLLMQMTFTSTKYSELRLVLTDGDVVSVAGYTVRYLDADGQPTDVKENVHIAYHGNLSNSKVGFDISGITVKPVCLKDVFPNGKEFPAKNGYSGEWSMGPDEEIVGITDVRPVYTADACDVTFVSDEKLGDEWVKDGEYEGKYVYKTIMGYESLVSFWCGDSQLEGGRTVSLIASENVFYLPTKPKFNDTIEGKWDVKIDRDGATFTVVYDLDTVNYRSALAFNYNGSDVTGATVQFNETTDPQGLTLMIPADVTVSGVTYKFLGWFEQKNGAWTKVETVMPSTAESAAHVDVTVEALWASEVSVTIVNANKANGLGSWALTATISTSGGTLAGSEELLSAVTVSAKVQYSTNKNASSPESWDANKNVKHDVTLGGGDSIDREFAYTSKDYLWCELRVTYSVNGAAAGTLSATANWKF